MASAMLLSLPAAAQEFTIERLSASPNINGASVQGLKMAPDGKRITFLRGKAENAAQLDLWEFDIDSGESRLLVDSASLLEGGSEVLSEEEKARRERNRAITGKTGIVSYFWSADSSTLLFPISGDVYVLPLGGSVKRLTDTPQYETDIKFSPQGTYVSFVRDREVYVVDIASGAETKLTSGSTDTIANGMSEFVAQEELSRFTGYWWSPDETRVAFEQFDESRVLVKDRYEVQPDGGVVTLKQRYPEAGSQNVEVKLGIVTVADQSVSWVDLGDNDDIYLARVNWTPDSQAVAVQRLNREQTTLDILMSDVSGATNTFVSESSDIWINLDNNMRFLSDGTMIRTNETSGFKHIVRHNMETGEATAITSGDWVVSAIEKIDEEAGTIYFSGFKDTPIEQHLYAVPLAGGDITRISQERGWHNATVGSEVYIDNFSSPEQPPQVTIRSLADGGLRSVVLANALDENHPYFDFKDSTPNQTFGTIDAVDGSKLYYRLYTPLNMEEGKRYPAILAPYGGPHGQRVRNQWSVNFNDILARNGFVVMVLDNRGMWNRGLEFEGHVKNAMGTVEVQDQVSGAEYLKTLSYVDGDNIGTWGWSYGGYMTLMSMFKEPDVFKAGVSVSPVTDWRLYDTAYTERYLGHPNAPGDVYANTSVFKYVDGFKGDLLLIHGMADDNVFFDHTVKLLSVLQNKGKPFELMTYPGKKHGIRGEKTRSHLWNQALDFFNRKLK
ncbi:MAG: S9 family peptidase [Kordiimonadaceae bacterium]|nr:S9 family peptidase [Kordiimonadaceae bacterium]MBO6570064.1 S9 family peptidase [Kordiimonadaceae bacterium]MBO6965839.1 S9 family peptidase [Kordiimonadaceae bacterium]